MKLSVAVYAVTENELINKLKNNDNEAYRHLVLTYSKRLYYHCLKILKNSFDAQDAVQITFIKIHSSINKFEKRCCLGSWIYRIATNVCLDILRKKKNNNYLSLSFEESEGYSSQFYEFPLTDKNSDTESQFLKKEDTFTLYKSINKLPDVQKRLITLRDIYGLSYNDISKKLNLKSGTVKSGLNRARKKLRTILEETGYNKE